MANDLMWNKLQSLRPSLPRHISFQRRDYNDEEWYLLQDNSNGRFHRLSPSAYYLLSFMDGRRSLQQILDLASSPDLYEFPDEIPQNIELIQLLQYLHVADLLVCDFPPSTQELFARQQLKRRQVWKRFLISPITWKFSLGNPDKWLDKCVPLVNWIISPIAGICWLLLVLYAMLQAGVHWSQLTQGQLHKILSPTNLFLLWLIYPVLKTFHELGHALLTKMWGGHVHEWGVVFILGTPLPYVDASASIAFKSKSKRLMVSAAGMAVEIFFAALALILWLKVNDGLFRDVLYNIILIGGVSTLFFNGNPLMRYDGYHLLTDVFDWPNLATRANQQLNYLVRRFGYGQKNLVMPAINHKEGILFVGYSLAAFAYRLAMLMTIITMIAKHFPVVGLLLAIWLIAFQFVMPIIQYFYFLLNSKQIEAHRSRALSVVSGCVLGLLVLSLVVPLPMSTRAEGVLWLPDDASVKAETSGEVVKQLVDDGVTVEKGQALLQLSNVKMATDLTIKKSMLSEYEARYQQAWADDRTKAQLLQQDISAIEAEIELLQKRIEHLTVTAAVSGVFHITQEHELMGSFVHQGDNLGVIVNNQISKIRAVLTQEEIGLVRQSTRRIEVRLASDPSSALEAHISQQVPAATFELPSSVLGGQGGGRIATDATRPDGTKAIQLIFLVDVSLDQLQQPGLYGQRAAIKFYHPSQPAALQLLRGLQQLFIRSFQ